VKVVLFGATGMVGQGVLRECLLDPEAENGKFLRERTSDLLGPESCTGYREVHSEA